MTKIFLCYVSEDKPSIKRIKDKLRKSFAAQNITRLEFFDYGGVPSEGPFPGEYDREIPNLLKQSQFFLVILSEAFLKRCGKDRGARISKELDFASQRKRELKPRQFGFALRLMSNGDFSLQERAPHVREITGDYCDEERIEALVHRMQSDFQWLDERATLANKEEHRPIQTAEVQDKIGKDAFRKIKSHFGANHVLFVMLGQRRPDYAPKLGTRQIISEEETKRITTCLESLPYRKAEKPECAFFYSNDKLLRADPNNIPIQGTKSYGRWLQISAVWKETSAKTWPRVVRHDQTTEPINAHDLFDKDEFWDSHLVFPVKAICNENNRDVLGFLIVNVKNKTKQQIPADTASLFTGWLRSEIINRARGLIEDATHRPTETLFRQRIQDYVLDAALALAGGDYGCVKSLCLGNTKQGDGLLAAECVLHCPVFFDEGKSPEADKLLNDVVVNGVGGIVNVGENRRILEGKDNTSTRHPSRQMYVVLITDTSDPRYPRPEPQATMTKDGRIIGAVIVSHTHANYLEITQKIYADDLKALVNMGSQQLVKAIHLEILESIQNPPGNPWLSDHEGIKKFVTTAVSETFERRSVSWTLLRISYESGGGTDLMPSTPKVFVSDCNEQERGAVLSILNFSNPEARRFSLFNYVLNARCWVGVSQIGVQLGGSKNIFRMTSHDDQTFAKFVEDHHLAIRDKVSAKLIFNIGSKKTFLVGFKDHGKDVIIHLLLVPLVFDSGRPVGLLAIWCKLLDFRHETLPPVVEKLMLRLKPVTNMLYLQGQTPKTGNSSAALSS